MDTNNKKQSNVIIVEFGNTGVGRALHLERQNEALRVAVKHREEEIESLRVSLRNVTELNKRQADKIDGLIATNKKQETVITELEGAKIAYESLEQDYLATVRELQEVSEESRRIKKDLHISKDRIGSIIKTIEKTLTNSYKQDKGERTIPRLFDEIQRLRERLNQTAKDLESITVPNSFLNGFPPSFKQEGGVFSTESLNRIDIAISNIDEQISRFMPQSLIDVLEKDLAKRNAMPKSFFGMEVISRSDLRPDVVVMSNFPLAEDLPEHLQSKPSPLMEDVVRAAKEREERINQTVKEVIQDKLPQTCVNCGSEFVTGSSGHYPGCSKGICPGCGCKTGEFHKKDCSLLNPVTFHCVVCHTPVTVTQVKCPNCTKANCPECKGAGVIKDSAAPHIQSKCPKCG